MNSLQDHFAAAPGLLADYPGAVVRIASLRALKAQHFLFGWVELYPFDMQIPQGWTGGNKPWPVPGLADFTLGFSATPVSTREALGWYAATAASTTNIALTSSKPVLAVHSPLSPEPALGRFSLGHDAPFSFQWHGQPRIHRLVAMRRVHRAVHQLGSSPAARTWLLHQLGFDLFDHQGWLGGAALLAPDPLCASLHISHSTRAGGPGGETLSLELTPRRARDRNADLTSLTVHVAERRAGAWTSIVSAPVPAGGHLSVDYPESTHELGWALVCAQRGLLRAVEPTSRIKTINTEIAISAGLATVEVPAGGRRKPAQSYEVATHVSTQKSTIGKAPPHAARNRLADLRDIRRRRDARNAAPQRLFGSPPDADSTQRDLKKREAQDFILELVRSARSRLVFVDPYFGVREARLFALQNHYPGLTTRILTGSSVLGILKDNDQSSPQQLQGNILLDDLNRISGQLAGSLPEVRVMPGGDTPVVHDRYLIVDAAVWHCGPSFNELGERLGVMVRLPDPMTVRAMVAKIWMASETLTDHMKERAEAGSDVQFR